jgi:hypothetical protein
MNPLKAIRGQIFMNETVRELIQCRKPKLVMIENDYLDRDSWAKALTTIGTIFTALTGRLTLVVEAEGGAVAHITDIPVGVPPCVRRTAQLAAGI